MRSIDEHEELLSELLQPELEQSRKTEILQELRTDFRTSVAEVEDLTKVKERLAKNNDDLIVANSQLFRQAGIVGTSKEKEVEKTALSETITIEELEKRASTL